MTYDKSSFLSGVAVGQQLRGWGVLRREGGGSFALRIAARGAVPATLDAGLAVPPALPGTPAAGIAITPEFGVALGTAAIPPAMRGAVTAEIHEEE